MKAKHKQPVGMDEGLYFGLHKDTYHNDPALSHSGMTQILRTESGYDYWVNSVLNPNRPKFEASDAMIFGERCHKLLLEGMAFFNDYNVHGMKDDRQKRWISRAEWTKIHDSVEMIKKYQAGADYFKFGYPEVSIFWRDPATGIMLRARVDYLRTFGAIDYKRIKDVGLTTIGNAIVDQGLDIQGYLYLEGIKRIRYLLRKGKIKAHGEVNKEWIDGFMGEVDTIFRFFFQRSAPPYVWEIYDFEKDLELTGQDWTLAATEKYKRLIELHGTSEWPAGTGKVTTVELFNIPRRIHDRKR